MNELARRSRVEACYCDVVRFFGYLHNACARKVVMSDADFVEAYF